MQGRRRRSWRVVVPLLAALAVLAWLATGGESSLKTPAHEPTAAEGSPSRTSPSAHVASAAAAGPGPVQPPPRTEPPRRGFLGVDLAKQAAAEYRRRARYPRSAQPLAPGEPDPIVRDREITPVEQRGPGGSEPALVVQPAQASFEAPEPAVLYAHLAVRGTPVAAREITATLLTEALVPIGTIAYRDDGAEGDPAAGDHRWTAVVALPPEATPALSASILVQVRALTARGEERKAATSFQYARPHARLTGRWRDGPRDGSLVVSAEIEVLEAGRFHLEATLYSDGGAEPLAWAQTAATLSPGLHWLELGYYGLILHERGVDGPYLVRYAALSTTSAMPNAKNRLVVDAHRTGPYSAASFTARPFDDPTLLEAADRLEQAPMPLAPKASG